MAYPVPEDWTISGILNKNGVPFSEGPRFDMESIGGTKLAENLVSAAEAYAARFAQKQLDAAKTKLQAELDRRKQEWTLEDDIDDAEIVEIEKQSVINDIKTQQLEKRYQNLEKEILRSEEAYDLLCNKFTNQQLYIHLEKDLGKTFKRYVNLLLEVARMAEWAYHFEIPNDSSQTYIQSNYWESLYKGLLAPEKILLDLRALEKAYLENDKHKMEITEPIVLETNLSQLISEGSCSITIENLNQKISEYNNGMRILDMRVQIMSNTSIAPYTKMFARLSLTNGVLENRNWATGMSFSEVDKLDFAFHSEQYLPFEGAYLTDSFTLYLKKDANTYVDFANAKVVLFITYTA